MSTNSWKTDLLPSCASQKMIKGPVTGSSRPAAGHNTTPSPCKLELVSVLELPLRFPVVQAAQHWYITAQTTPRETELLCSLEHTTNKLSHLVSPTPSLRPHDPPPARLCDLRTHFQQILHISSVCRFPIALKTENLTRPAGSYPHS